MRNRIYKFIIALAAVVSFIPSTSSAQSKPPGMFDGQTDVGQVNKPGSVTYDAEKQAYTISGSGTNMWGDRDEFHFLWKRMKGNFILTARVRFVGRGVEAH